MKKLIVNKLNSKKSENIEGVWAAAGFALVLIVVGLPIWWYTTTVYRANLPYSTIENLAGRPTFQTVHITLVGDNYYEHEESIKNVLQSEDKLVRFTFSARFLSPNEKNLIASENNLENLGELLPPYKIIHPGTLLIYFIGDQNERLGGGNVFISQKRMILVKDLDYSKLCEIISSMTFDNLANEKFTIRSKPDLVQMTALTQSMRQMPTEPGYDVTLTLMLPEPHLLRAKWNARKSIEDYLNPIVDQFSDILDLRIQSQILYMNILRVSPKWSQTGKYYALPEQQLPLTINHIEPKLGSFVSTRPALHFIIYVPCDHQTPLKIVDNAGNIVPSNSFLVPRWGGVLLHNPPTNFTQEVTSKGTPIKVFDLDVHWTMQTIITQIYKLFPVPTVSGDNSVQVASTSNGLLADWQLDGVARGRLFDYLSNIQITLQSLCELVGEISNMVVSDEVSHWVMSAVDLWQDCLEAAREGRLKEATQLCTSSFSHSDAAFFHPSMLALLYFPDNQKYAIYVPLFLPVSIPVLLSLRMIFRIFWGDSKSKKEE